jgi:hypothetical protein
MKKRSMFRLVVAEGLRMAMSSGNDTSKKNVTWRGGGGGGDDCILPEEKEARRDPSRAN